MRVLCKPLSRVLHNYYRGPDHPMKMRLWGWLRKLLGHSRLTIRYADNGWITVEERDLIERSILAGGAYEPEVWQTLRGFARGNEVVWDVGSHVGSFSIRALLDPHVREVHAFEPDPIQLQALVINLKLNGGCYTIHPFGLSDRQEVLSLYHGPSANTGLSSFLASLGREVFPVECRRVDDLVFQEGVNPPTLMKVDVEGFERRVFQGAKRLLTELPPKALVFEEEWGADRGSAHAAEYVKGLGYRVWRIRRPSGITDRRENFLAARHPVGHAEHGMLEEI